MKFYIWMISFLLGKEEDIMFIFDNFNLNFNINNSKTN